MNDPLPAEIAAALAHAGQRAVRARRITTLRSPLHPRAVYRIELASGAVVKARSLEDDATAHALDDLRRELPPAFVPILARHGRVLLEPWVDGVDLGGRPPDDPVLVTAAGLLAALHATTTAAGRRVRDVGSTRPWRTRSEQALVAIARCDALDDGEPDRLAAALARLDPETAVVGLVHTDFCGENMVVDAAGALHVIDNERVSVDALGYDLGRTWARWDLSDAAWTCFAAAYAARGGPPEALAGLAFWRIVASATAAATRLALEAATPDTFARLRRLAAELA